MADNFDLLLDTCLDRLTAGEDIERILADYPSDSAKLRPLLQMATKVNLTGSFDVNPETKHASHQRFNDALIASRETTQLKNKWFGRLFLHPAFLTTISVIAVIVLAVFAGVKTALSPEYLVSPVTPVASSSGNFAFLISDDINAIADFSSVVVNIKQIGLQQSDDKWIELIPTVSSVDLTQFPGYAAQEMWHGDIPVDNYRQEFIYVDNITGILKSSGQPVEIKLPSQKLHLNMAFTVSNTEVTRFTYDLTVIATGNSRNTKYLLKPQAAESGVKQGSQDIPEKKGQNNSTIPDENPVGKPDKPSKTPKK
jgi:hypothetical protein